MSDDEIRIVAEAICTAHVKEGVGDWRAYKEIATSIIAGIDALDQARKPKKAPAPSVMAMLSQVAPATIPATIPTPPADDIAEPTIPDVATDTPPKPARRGRKSA